MNLFHHDATESRVWSALDALIRESLSCCPTIGFEAKDQNGENELRDAQREHEVESHIAGRIVIECAVRGDDGVREDV